MICHYADDMQFYLALPLDTKVAVEINLSGVGNRMDKGLRTN